MKKRRSLNYYKLIYRYQNEIAISFIEIWKTNENDHWYFCTSDNKWRLWESEPRYKRESGFIREDITETEAFLEIL